MFVTLATEQLSAVTGVPNATPKATQLAFALTVIAAGAVIVGFIVSVTVTVCVAVAVFPEASVTVHVTVVVPTGNAVGALFVTLAMVQLSVVTGVPKLRLVTVHPVVKVVAIFAGAVITGMMLSITVTF